MHSQIFAFAYYPRQPCIRPENISWYASGEFHVLGVCVWVCLLPATANRLELSAMLSRRPTPLSFRKTTRTNDLNHTYNLSVNTWWSFRKTGILKKKAYSWCVCVCVCVCLCLYIYM